MSSTNRNAPHCAIPSVHQLPRPSQTHMFSQHSALSPSQTHKFPQHSALIPPQPSFLLQYKRPRFTPIQNNRQNYNSVYFNLYIIGKQTGRQTILDRIMEDVQFTLKFSMNAIFVLKLFLTMWTLPQFQTFVTSLCCAFALHAAFEIWTIKWLCVPLRTVTEIHRSCTDSQ